MLRIGAIGALFLGSTAYCAAVDLELIHDTRYRAEKWLEDNVDSSEPIGVFAHAQYLPRFTLGTHRAVPLEMTPETFAATRPTHLVLSSFNYDDYNTVQRQCMDDLLSGAFGYSRIASFSKRYLPPAKNWLAIVGWGTRGAGKASPNIIILKDMNRGNSQEHR